MVRMTIRYDGELGTTTVHEPSGTVLRTDAPKDNAGRGTSSSPTDLLAAALGTCALTTMAILARRDGIPFEAAAGDVAGGPAIAGEVRKEMTATPPRRVQRLTLVLRLPAGLSAEHRAALERAGRNCPVALSLHPDVTVDMRFE